MEDAINVAVQLVNQNPKTAGFLALVPVIQGLGWLLARVFPAHTIAARIGQKIAAFPVRLPARTDAPAR